MNLRPVALLALLLALICFISPFRPVAAEYLQHIINTESKLICSVFVAKGKCQLSGAEKLDD